LAWQGTEEDEEGEQVSEQQTGSLVDLVQGARKAIDQATSNCAEALMVRLELRGIWLIAK